MSHPPRTAIAFIAIAGVLGLGLFQAAQADTPRGHTCTAFEIPFQGTGSKKKPLEVGEVALPAGWVPIGGTSTGLTIQGTGHTKMLVVACKDS